MRKTVCFLLMAIWSGCTNETEPTPPAARFEFTSDNSFLAPSTITFSNGSTNAKDYTWDFGDGSPISNNINPIHLFEKGGNYTVTLIASNSNAVDQINQTITITDKPIADFEFSSNNNFKAGSPLTFTNKSKHSDSYQWTFGDGETSTIESPTHTFSQSGTYTVILTAVNSKASSIKTSQVFIIPNQTVEEIQLTKLKSAWSLVSANDGNDRTGDFPNLVLTLSGSYSQGGIYNYSFTGTRPTPSPWASSGTWKFGTDPLTQIIRDAGTPLELDATYEVSDTELQLVFTIPDNWVGGRIKSVSGKWTFRFARK